MYLYYSSIFYETKRKQREREGERKGRRRRRRKEVEREKEMDTVFNIQKGHIILYCPSTKLILIINIAQGYMTR